MRRQLLPAVPLALALALVPALAACGGATGSSAGGRPTVAVTTDVLGEAVSRVVGDLAEVEVVMPDGASPHDFQPSPRQAEAMREADALVVNGADLEEGLLAGIDAAESDGVPTIAAIDGVTPLAGDPHGQEEADAAHDHDGIDPHFFTDPVRMAEAVEHIARGLADAVPELDRSALARRADAYVAELHALDAEVAGLLADLPDDRREMVTHHDVFGYFADRYDLEILGAVIPSGTTQAQPSAGELDALARAVEAAGVPAIFVDTSSSRRSAETLADEVGSEVAVVELYTESLGDEGSGADTYAGMVRTNAERIAAALGE